MEFRVPGAGVPPGEDWIKERSPLEEPVVGELSPQFVDAVRSGHGNELLFELRVEGLSRLVGEVSGADMAPLEFRCALVPASISHLVRSVPPA